MQYIVVKNFEKFQHYHDRVPPWIKLYNALLDDYAFIRLSDAARSHLVLIWLVASRHNNRIPFDAKYIAEAIHTRAKVDVERLVLAGFLTIIDADDAEVAQDASTVLAEPAQDASQSGASCTESGDLEKRRGEKRQSRGEKNPSRVARTTWMTPFADAWHERFGGKMPMKQHARSLRDVVDSLGAEEALTRWRFYLEHTDAQYASAPRFAATPGAWTPGAVAAPKTLPRGLNTAAETQTYLRARVLLALAHEYNLLTYNGNRTEYLERVEKACADPKAGPTIREDLQAVRFSQGIGDQSSEHFAHLEIARRLDAAAKLAAAVPA